VTRSTGFFLAILAAAGLALGAPVCCAVGLKCCALQVKTPVEEPECQCCKSAPRPEPEPAPQPCTCDEHVEPIGTHESAAKIHHPQADVIAVEFDLAVAVPADSTVLRPEGRDTPVPISRYVTLPLLI
jgi:hypothetical protein